MRYIIQRFIPRLSGRFLLAVLLIAAAGALAFFVVPGGIPGPPLELLAQGSDGEFESWIAVPESWVREQPRSPDGLGRVPLVLAVRNPGRYAVRPRELEIALPARYRLFMGDGSPLDATMRAANPLLRYRLDLRTREIPPGAAPLVLDTLWLEPLVPTLYCVALSDSVPHFVAAPPPSVEAQRIARIFYSFRGGTLRERNTGLLDVEIPTSLLEWEESPRVAEGRTVVRERGIPLPAMSGLRYAGSRRSSCGAPEDPLELLTSLWETQENGRLFVLTFGGVPRKYLFDLNRDSIVELEMWDPDGDGRFEAGRATRFPIPAFLIPPPPPPPPTPVLAADTVGMDTLTAPMAGAPPAAGPAGIGAPAPPPEVMVEQAEREEAEAEAAAARPPRPAGPRLLGRPVEEEDDE